MLREQIHRNIASAGLICFYDLVNDFHALLFTSVKIKRHHFCICFFCHIIQTYLFNLQLITDRFNSRKSTVKLRKNCVNSAGGKNRFTCVVVSCVSFKYLCVMSAAKLKILSYAGTAYKLKAFCTCRLCLCNCFRAFQFFLKINKNCMLMSGDHNIYVFRVNYAKSYRSHADLRLSQENIVQKICQCQSVKSCGNSKLQTVCKHINRIGIQVCRTFYHSVEYFSLCTSRKNPQFFPSLETRCIGKLFYQLHFFIFRLIQIIQNLTRNFFCLFVNVITYNAHFICQIV